MFIKFLILIISGILGSVVFAIILRLNRSTDKSNSTDSNSKAYNIPRWDIIHPEDIKYCQIGNIKFVPNSVSVKLEDHANPSQCSLMFNLNPEINYGELQTWMGIIQHNIGKKDIYSLTIQAKLRSGEDYNLSGCFISELTNTSFTMFYDFGSKIG